MKCNTSTCKEDSTRKDGYCNRCAAYRRYWKSRPLRDLVKRRLQIGDWTTRLKDMEATRGRAKR